MDPAFPNPVRPIFDPPLHNDSVIVHIRPSPPATHGPVQILAPLAGPLAPETHLPAPHALELCFHAPGDLENVTLFEIRGDQGGR